ncbi:2-deoxy-D-gluconate 3-dehydrogenase [Nocardioides baekrokdamisoli]|uniref:2-deoxy-D-gluconate 3-dehydrogenase n=1 Tax=Nocardioides baekrokdamisoli TaxID=1804624 RepID=A0A3G9IEP1_9ACTN|nr:SDR family oxidoreductase [Nocardioides baekrokdamisoli]BBH16752.1 2-deoxy-D-gluconate 3-dehydrogenase [Nocardioides baekrokdamisoli]
MTSAAMTWVEHTFGLAGKTALVTGARTGIGRACALALAEAGADLVLWGRSAGDCDEVADEVRDLGRTATCVVAALDDREAVLATAAELLASVRIDVLVNNAGTIKRAPAAEMSLEDWDLVRAVNLDATFLLTQRFGAAMVARGSGSVITVASLLSFQGGVTVPGYAATKHAVAGLTKAFANEWAAHGVNVNAVAPGYVVTNNTDALRADTARSTAISARIPAGRWAQPEDIAPAVVFLAGRGAAYVHGEVLTVDGGWMAR